MSQLQDKTIDSKITNRAEHHEILLWKQTFTGSSKVFIQIFVEKLGQNNIDDGETLNIKMLPCKNHKNVVHTKFYRSPPRKFARQNRRGPGAGREAGGRGPHRRENCYLPDWLLWVCPIPWPRAHHWFYCQLKTIQLLFLEEFCHWNFGLWRKSSLILEWQML